MIASTPAAASTCISSGSSTVQTSTRRSLRRAWATRGVRRREHRRRGRGAATGGRGLRATAAAVSMIGPVHEEPGRQLGRVRPHRVDRSRGRRTRTRRRARASRTRSTAARATAFSGSASGSHREHFTSTFTSHPAHASSASASVGSHGQRGADLGERLRRPAGRPVRPRRRDGRPGRRRRCGARRARPRRHPTPAPARRRRRCSPGRGGWRPDGPVRAVATACGAGYEHPKDATCSTFDRECPGQDPCAVVHKAVTLPILAAGSGQRRPDTHVSGRTRPASVRPIRRGN